MPRGLSLLLALLLAGCSGGAPAADGDNDLHDEEQAAAHAPAGSGGSRDNGTQHGAPAAARPAPANATPLPPPANATLAGNASAAGPAPVRVAILDTGIRATHKAFAPGQVVAWYDFGRSGRPDAPTELWDPAVEPYDEEGHGTAVASMVGGQGADQTPSHAPGVELVVAKITSAENSARWADVAAAMRWAREVAGADIVSLSFYSYLPQPGGLGADLLNAIERARADGMLPVVLAGNGMDNLGAPTVSWAHPPASSRHALIVGGAGATGSPVAPLGSMDPEVTALYTMEAACPASDDCYETVSGTSFSTPLVAGMAAQALAQARAAGQAADADRLELLLKRCAADTVAPPILEGYGYLGAPGAACAAEHAAAGTDPPAPDPVTEAWVETVQDSERQAWGG